MPDKTLPVISVMTCILMVLGGCKPRMASSGKKTPPIDIPAHVSGTIGQYARVSGGNPFPVKGYCVVVGLGKNGSSEVPPLLGKYLKQYFLKLDFTSYRGKAKGLTVGRFLRDLDTAVVEVTGIIPPGAPEGSKFDVIVRAIPETQTRSLDGGILLPAELRLAIGGPATAGKGSKVMARSGGPIMVNPMADEEKNPAPEKLRIGLIPGGGRVLKSRPIQLVLRRADYGACKLIEQKINGRFSGKTKIATAKNPSIIAIQIPPDKNDEYREFMELILHLPIRSQSDDYKIHAEKIAKEMAKPSAKHHDLALVWEAMGNQTISFARPLYKSKNLQAAFYAARTGMRLGDDIAADVVMYLAAKKDFPLRVQAVEELGRHPKVARASLTLQRLVNDENDMVRLAAYQAMLDRGNRAIVTRTNIYDDFNLDMVSSHRGYAIYATQSGQSKIVLFGMDMPVICPVFFSYADDLVTINANKGDKKLTVYRKVPGSGEFSDSLYVEPNVPSLIQALGSLPTRGMDGKFNGLGLTYSQVVGVLYRMCKSGDIRAKFHLQGMPKMQRIRPGQTVGRPDMPEG